MSFSVSPELIRLGLTPFFVQQLQSFAQEHPDLDWIVARIVCERRGEYELASEHGFARAALSGRLEHHKSESERPTVGDWVLFEPGVPVGRIHHVFERKNALRRLGVFTGSHAQNLAANVDLCCIVSALTEAEADEHAQRRALNPRRIERYLVMARASRVPALVLLNKADLLPTDLAEARLNELRERVPDAPLLLVSAQSGLGLSALLRELSPGTSVVLLGSSGVGKSSLVNALLGHSLQRVGAERTEDTRGRHTTTERHLLSLPSGALLIDTPGMRELALWADADTDLTEGSFEDIEALARGCRFRDCRHRGEPGCAVAAAVESGTLDPERIEHAHKLERELWHQRARVDARLRQAEQNRWKVRARATRAQLRTKARD
jgi:ribosome biogenesis GTPase